MRTRGELTNAEIHEVIVATACLVNDLLELWRSDTVGNVAKHDSGADIKTQVNAVDVNASEGMTSVATAGNLILQSVDQRLIARVASWDGGATSRTEVDRRTTSICTVELRNWSVEASDIRCIAVSIEDEALQKVSDEVMIGGLPYLSCDSAGT